MLRRYGILRQPRLASRALFVEAVIALGQVVIDRNATGIRGRGNGWRAARGLSRRAFTPDGLPEPSRAMEARASYAVLAAQCR